MFLHQNDSYSASVLISVQQTEHLYSSITVRSNRKILLQGKSGKANSSFTFWMVFCVLYVVSCTWLVFLLLLAGDIHPNPGPSISSSVSSVSSTSTSMSNSLFSSLNLSHNLSFVHYNVQSILTKLDTLYAELYGFDILAFTETWLNPSVGSCDLLLESYCEPERKDRPGDSHGGLMIYIKEGLRYKRRDDLEPRNIECIWLELANCNRRLLFGLFYRPPSSDSEYFTCIENSIALAVDTGISDIIITGDFNFDLLNERASRKIVSICTQYTFFQAISQPTNFTEHSATLIDILLVNNENHLILSGVGDPFLNQEIRYHCPIYGIFKFSKNKIHSFTRRIWSYDKGNYELLRNKAAEIDWDALRDNDIDTYAANLHSTITSLASECIPNKLVKIKPAEPSWINANIKQYIRKRKRAYRKARRTNTELHWTRFKTLRNKTVALIRDAKKAFHDKIASKLTSGELSSKDWWTVLKTFISPQSKTSIPPLENNGTISTDENEKANILNNFFQSQTCLNIHHPGLPNILHTAVNTELNNIEFCRTEVESVLKSLPIGKASGPNNLSNRVLRELTQEISSPFCNLFNQSLNSGLMPSSYKEANVCPIYKKGDKSIVSNYRPISLLNSESKLFERLVFKYLYNHLRDNNLLSSLQSGFIPGDSTVNQLTFLYDTFCQALDSGKEVRAVFCDVSKAFDRVWHDGLVLKLKAAGVTGKVLAWFNSYLSNRKQRVILPGATSGWADIHAGVPQGSILGPLLFLLFINDIVLDIGSNIRLFADDTSLYIVVDNPVTAANCLNIDLETISKWAETWLVSFNPTKTESLLISRKLNKLNHPPITMQNVQITEVDFHKHLGVYLSNDCTWHHHIEYISQKAWGRINVMRKLKFKLDRKSLETIYTAFIRPLLEYGDVIWDNCTQYEKQELERIQLEAARIATGATKLVSINALYKEVRWEPLEQRRQTHKLTLFYKMFSHLTPLYLSSLIPPSVSDMSRYNLRNSDHLQTIESRTNLYYNSFLPSTIRAWNNLPSEVKQFQSTNSFKYYLNKDKTPVPRYYYTKNRKAQILHTRLRTNCSSLNLDLFVKGISESPICRCGSIENSQHFFFHCPYYQPHRNLLLNVVSTYHNPTLDLFLYGESSLSYDINVIIFNNVQQFILNSKRFSS